MIWLRRLLVPLLLATPLVFVLRAGTRASIAGTELGWLAAALWAVCAAITALALVGASSRSKVVTVGLQAVAALVWGGFAAFHLRETTAFPPATWSLGACGLLFASLCFFVLRWTCGGPVRSEVTSRSDAYLPTARRRGWGWLALTMLLAAALPTVIYLLGGDLRWHLLQHVKVLGSPVQAVLGQAPASIETEQLRTIALPASEAAAPIAERYGPAVIPFEASASAPSIVFVLLDTLRADAFEAWGGAVDMMPRLAETMDRCQRFGDMLANSSWTRPSIASMHTGLLPEHHGARSVVDPLASEHTTFVEVLQAAGYRTAALVANPTAGPDTGLDQGFDHFTLLERDPYARAELLHRAARELLDDLATGATAGTSVDGETDAAVGPPTFLYLHFLDPHDPYLAGTEPNGFTRASYLDAYQAELEYLDAQLADLLPDLRQRLGPDTLFFLISDHGEEFFEHGLFGHGHTLYREVVEIPAILCGGPFEGGVIQQRLEGRDVFSLLLSLADGSIASNVDLVRWARDHDRPRRHMYLSFQGFGQLVLRPYLQSIYQRAVNTPDGTWIWNAYGNTWEYYLSSDREQVSNEAFADAAPEHPALDQIAPAPWLQADPMQMSDAERKRLERLGYVQ